VSATLRSRLWLTYAILAAVSLCLVASGLIVYLIRNPQTDRQDYLSLNKVSDQLLQRAEGIEGLQSSPQETAQQIDRLLDVRVIFLGPDRQIEADSRVDEGAGFGPLALRAFRRGQGVTRDQSGRAWIYVTRSLENGDRLILATPRRGGLTVLLAQRLREVWREDILPALINAAIVALVLALVLAYGMAQWVAAPLQHITSAARRVASGKYGPIRPEGPREVQELASAFNDMSAQVEASEQSQRDFVANVSHELKTPLTSIQGFAQAILDGAASTPDELKQAASVIHGEAGRMHRLVLELLDLARFDAGTISLEEQPVELLELLGSVTRRFEPLAKDAQVSLESRIGEMPVVIGDGDRLAQVFDNLVENALKFTPPGGQVRLEAERNGEFAEIRVSDTGPGIAPEDFHRIFERFYQTDQSRQGGKDRGAGLGLAIARQIVSAHGGSLTVQNNPPQGALFVVKLPFVRRDESMLASRGGKNAVRKHHRAMLQ